MSLELLNIPQAKIAQFNKKGIFEIDDLLRYLPRKYQDFKKPKKITETVDGELCSVICTIDSIDGGITKSKIPYISVSAVDESGRKFDVIYYRQTFMANKIEEIYNRYGRVMFSGRIQMSPFRQTMDMRFINPDSVLPPPEDKDGGRLIRPVYSKITGMADTYLKDCIRKSINTGMTSEYLESELLAKYNLLSSSKALYGLHFPETIEDIKDGKKRMIFDDLFYFNYLLKRNEERMVRDTKHILTKHDKVDGYISNLPFELTEDQSDAVKRIIDICGSGKKANCIVQGDVGAGKTEIAKCALLLNAENGYQSVLLAPTTVLAKQHYNDICESFEGIEGINIGFLSSELKKSEQNKVHKAIKKGEYNIIVGTHSLLSDLIEFNNLGMVVVDEEHKFGVRQREKLLDKTSDGIHFISMSATLIPRTMSLGLFGSAEVITVKQLPAGRKPIKTSKVDNNEEAYKKLLEELKNGHQAYVVCPLITEEEEEYNVLNSVHGVSADIMRALYKTNYKVGILTGKMKKEECDEVIKKFKNNEIQVLVSTTVIEVGVNVPNSTVMWIKSAERFGLAQMHQLRGRVGRGKDQGYCLLQVSDDYRGKPTPNIDVMCQTTDGFEITKEDLRLRGSGNLIGTEQSGDNKYITLMLTYPEINKAIRDEIDEIFKDDDRRALYEERLYRQILRAA